jgi:hypothetical protein
VAQEAIQEGGGGVKGNSTLALSDGGSSTCTSPSSSFRLRVDRGFKKQASLEEEIMVRATFHLQQHFIYSNIFICNIFICTIFYSFTATFILCVHSNVYIFSHYIYIFISFTATFCVGNPVFIYFYTSFS